MAEPFGGELGACLLAVPLAWGGEHGAESGGAPRSARCPTARLGARWIALDVAADGHQMRVVLDQERLVAALVEMALAAGAVPGLGVALGQPAHEAAKIAIGMRPEHEMPVVGHQAPGEQTHAAALALLGE